jgi:hypothetical protein
VLKFLILLVLLGAAIYAIIRLTEGRNGRGRGGGGRAVRRPVAPDDDPDFLRDLNRKRPHKERPHKDQPESEEPDAV